MRLVIFVLLNFGALALGSLLQADGPEGSWYQNLDKAPWTPPGWVFAAAWFFIMACFSVYMARAVRVEKSNRIYILFFIQFILNVGWNAVFFNFHETGLALLVIILLLLVVIIIALFYIRSMKWYSLLMLPYIAWLIIATSLNAYAYVYN